MIIILFMLAALPLLVFAIRSAMGKKSSLTAKDRIIRAIYVSLLVFYSLLLVGDKYNYYLRGYRSTSFVFFAATLSGIAYCLSDRRQVSISLTRTFFYVIAVLFMAGSGFLIVELIDDYKKQLFYSDRRYRLESTSGGIMAPCGLPVLYIKKGIIERQSLGSVSDSMPDCFSKVDVYDISIRQTDSAYEVSYSFLMGSHFNDSIVHTANYHLP